jgi:CheY-like chemotaxis protein
LFHGISRSLLGVACLLTLLARVPGAEEDDFRRFFKPPETAPEFWKALKFEISVGKFDLAANHLRGFAGKATEKDLLQIEEQEGMSAFLRLRSIPEGLRDPKERDALRKEVDQLIDKVSAALKKELTDPKRIGKFVKNLSRSPEERAYALVQLQRSGAEAVPYLVAELQGTAGSSAHGAILSALVQLDDAIVPPLLAALDAKDPDLQLDLLEVLRKRGQTSAVPALWYLSAGPAIPDVVRRKATETLSYLLETPPDKLPQAKAALTALAERYYQHQTKFVDPRRVVVWNWDGKKLALPPVTLSATQAEEYYGLRFARQALEIDPAYPPAQVVFLSLALDKAYGPVLDGPLGQKAPAVKELLTSVNPDLVTTVLDRALTERRLPVILGAVQALGDLSEVSAVRASSSGAPGSLLKALNYPDRRVQFAAASAVLRMPGSPAPGASARVIEILRRAAASDPLPKILVGFFEQRRADLVRKTVEDAGYEAVVVHSGRDVLRRLKEASDIDVILIEHSLPLIEMPFLLAQLRSDIDYGLLPLLISAPPQRTLPLTRLAERYQNVWVVPEALTMAPESLKNALRQHVQEAAGRPFTEAERKEYSEKAMDLLAKLARGEIRGYSVQPAEGAIVKALRSNELAGPAIEALGRMPGRVPQRELAALVLDPARPGKLRSAAALELSRHIQKNGLVLNREQIKAVYNLFNTAEDAQLKSSVAVVVGAMRPDAVQTGRRLQEYTPGQTPPPKEEVPEKAAKPKEAKPKDDKPKDGK